MQKVVTTEEMRSADNCAINSGTPSIVLMERAGKNIFKLLTKDFELENKNLLIVCSNGGNGGDGLVLARYLFENNYDVEVYLISKESRNKDFLTNLDKYHGKIVEKIDGKSYDFLIDAIFGVGLDKDIEGEYFSLIQGLNRMVSYKISIDMPSGISSNTGLVKNIAFKADLTYSIQYYKIGQFINDGKDYCGKIKVVDIGITGENKVNILENNDFNDYFKERKSNVNKGNYKKVCVIGGSPLYMGAPLMSYMAMASLRVGVGYSCLAIPKKIKENYSINFVEPIYYELDCNNDGYFKFNEDNIKHLLTYDSIIIGMGFSASEEVYKLISYLLKNYTKSLLIDADGLNSLAKYGVDILLEKKCNVVLTPHLKEFSRLVGKNIDEIKENTLEIAMNFAKTYKINLVLKSNSSIITNGNICYLNINGNSGLAKGGSGDFLSGIIGGLIVNDEDILKRCALGSYILGRCADLAIKDINKYSLIASDLLNYINMVIKEIQYGN